MSITLHVFGSDAILPFLNTCCCIRSLCDRYTCEEGYSYFMQAFMRQGTHALLIGHAHIIGYVFV